MHETHHSRCSVAPPSPTNCPSPTKSALAIVMTPRIVPRERTAMSSQVEAAGRVGPKLAPFTPSGDGVLTHALDLLQLSPADVLYDLGCGDARLLVYAARLTGARCVGVEYDSALVQKARGRVEESEVGHLVEIKHQDALQVDISQATALFMYLVPQGLKMLLPKLEEARARGIRIVTYVFSIPGWEYAQVRNFKGTKVYLYSPLLTDDD